jgi:DNA-directed RNA polymerase subunit RPC12/RpoP
MSVRSNSISGTDDVRCDRCGYRLRGLRPDGRCPECGLAIRASIEARKPRRRAPESGLKPPYFVLIMLLAGYALANLLSIALVWQEIVHPPEAALWFFTLPAPALGIVVLLSYQAFAGSRRFNWLVVPAVLAAMILAAYLSLLTLGWAYQGV